MRTVVLLFGAGLLSCTLYGQEKPTFAFNAGAGFTTPVGGTSRRLDTGFNAGIGAGVNFNSWLGTMLEFNFNDNSVNQGTLNALGFPDGTVRLWSLTLDPVVHVNHHGPVDVYFIGGGGLYHRTQEFTQPTIATVTAYDPWFGFYQAAIPANEVLSSYSVNKWGVNGGMGIAFGTRWHGKLYAEARYHRMFLGSGRHTDIVPVTFGFRW